MIKRVGLLAILNRGTLNQMIIALVAPNEYGKIYNLNFHVMKRSVIEVRTNYSNEGDVANYKATIKCQLFGKALKSG